MSPTKHHVTDELAALEQQLRAAGQEHVLSALGHLAPADRAARLAPLLGVPVGRLTRLVERSLRDAPAPDEAPGELRPLGWIQLPRTPAEHEARARACAAGEALLRVGRVGALLVAGGLGTRLGWDGPKGTFPIGPVTDRTLFQHFAEQLRAVARRYGRPVPWAIQTSAANHEVTVAFFEEHGFFGLDPALVRFFPQGDLPAFDEQARILLDGDGGVVAQPDGHGGVFPALARHGVLDWYAGLGIEHVFYFQVDNPLVPLCDPAFLGAHVQAGSEMSTLAVRKEDPFERVGVVALRDGTPCVVEYTELPPELAQTRDAEGLAFCAGSVAIHAFSLPLLRRMAHEPERPVHLARKPVQRQGAPTLPGVKLEYFVFDAMPYAERVLVMELDRATGFAPVKNGEGTDSPATARAMMTAVWRSWLERWDPRLSLPADAPIEVSPLFALDEADLRARPVPAEPLAPPIVL